MSSTDPKIEQKTDEGEGYQFLSEKDVAPFTKAEVTRSLMMCQTTLAETNAQAQQVELSRDSYYRKLGREQTAHREALQAAETAQKSLEAAVKAQKAAELQAATAVGTNADLKAQKKAADEKVSKLELELRQLKAGLPVSNATTHTTPAAAGAPDANVTVTSVHNAASDRVPSSFSIEWQNLPMFLGDANGQTVREFLRKFSQLFELHWPKCPIDARAPYLRARLDGLPLRLITTKEQPEDGGEPHQLTLAEMVEALLKQYHTEASRKEALVKFRQQRKREDQTVSAYQAQLEKLAKPCLRATDYNKVGDPDRKKLDDLVGEQFFNSLDAKLEKQLNSMPVLGKEDYDNQYDRVTAAEKVLNIANQRTQNRTGVIAAVSGQPTLVPHVRHPNLRPPRGGNQGHRGRQFGRTQFDRRRSGSRNNDARHSPSRNNFQRGGNSSRRGRGGSQRQGERQRFDGNCHFCGIYGHMQVNCFRRQREDQSPGRNTSSDNRRVSFSDSRSPRTAASCTSTPTLQVVDDLVDDLLDTLLHGEQQAETKVGSLEMIPPVEQANMAPMAPYRVPLPATLRHLAPDGYVRPSSPVQAIDQSRSHSVCVAPSRPHFVACVTRHPVQSPTDCRPSDMGRTKLSINSAEQSDGSIEANGAKTKPPKLPLAATEATASSMASDPPPASGWWYLTMIIIMSVAKTCSNWTVAQLNALVSALFLCIHGDASSIPSEAAEVGRSIGLLIRNGHKFLQSFGRFVGPTLLMFLIFGHQVEHVKAQWETLNGNVKLLQAGHEKIAKQVKGLAHLVRKHEGQIEQNGNTLGDLRKCYDRLDQSCMQLLQEVQKIPRSVTNQVSTNEMEVVKATLLRMGQTITALRDDLCSKIDNLQSRSTQAFGYSLKNRNELRNLERQVKELSKALPKAGKQDNRSGGRRDQPGPSAPKTYRKEQVSRPDLSDMTDALSCLGPPIAPPSNMKHIAASLSAMYPQRANLRQEPDATEEQQNLQFSALENYPGTVSPTGSTLALADGQAPMDTTVTAPARPRHPAQSVLHNRPHPVDEVPNQEPAMDYTASHTQEGRARLTAASTSTSKSNQWLDNIVNQVGAALLILSTFKASPSAGNGFGDITPWNPNPGLPVILMLMMTQVRAEIPRSNTLRHSKYTPIDDEELNPPEEVLRWHLRDDLPSRHLPLSNEILYPSGLIDCAAPRSQGTWVAIPRKKNCTIFNQVPVRNITVDVYTAHSYPTTGFPIIACTVITHHICTYSNFWGSVHVTSSRFESTPLIPNECAGVYKRVNFTTYESIKRIYLFDRIARLVPGVNRWVTNDSMPLPTKWLDYACDSIKNYEISYGELFTHRTDRLDFFAMETSLGALGPHCKPQDGLCVFGTKTFIWPGHTISAILNCPYQFAGRYADAELFNRTIILPDHSEAFTLDKRMHIFCITDTINQTDPKMMAYTTLEHGYIIRLNPPKWPNDKPSEHVSQFTQLDDGEPQSLDNTFWRKEYLADELNVELTYIATYEERQAERLRVQETRINCHRYNERLAQVQANLLLDPDLAAQMLTHRDDVQTTAVGPWAIRVTFCTAERNFTLIYSGQYPKGVCHDLAPVLIHHPHRDVLMFIEPGSNRITKHSKQIPCHLHIPPLYPVGRDQRGFWRFEQNGTMVKVTTHDFIDVPVSNIETHTQWHFNKSISSAVLQVDTSLAMLRQAALDSPTLDHKLEALTGVVVETSDDPETLRRHIQQGEVTSFTATDTYLATIEKKVGLVGPFSIFDHTSNGPLSKILRILNVVLYLVILVACLYLCIAMRIDLVVTRCCSAFGAAGQNCTTAFNERWNERARQRRQQRRQRQDAHDVIRMSDLLRNQEREVVESAPEAGQGLLPNRARSNSEIYSQPRLRPDRPTDSRVTINDETTKPGPSILRRSSTAARHLFNRITGTSPDLTRTQSEVSVEADARPKMVRPRVARRMQFQTQYTLASSADVTTDAEAPPTMHRLPACVNCGVKGHSLAECERPFGSQSRPSSRPSSTLTNTMIYLVASTFVLNLIGRVSGLELPAAINPMIPNNNESKRVNSIVAVASGHIDMNYRVTCLIRDSMGTTCTIPQAIWDTGADDSYISLDTVNEFGLSYRPLSAKETQLASNTETIDKANLIFLGVVDKCTIEIGNPPRSARNCSLFVIEKACSPVILGVNVLDQFRPYLVTREGPIKLLDPKRTENVPLEQCVSSHIDRQVATQPRLASCAVKETTDIEPGDTQWVSCQWTHKNVNANSLKQQLNGLSLEVTPRENFMRLHQAFMPDMAIKASGDTVRLPVTNHGNAKLRLYQNKRIADVSKLGDIDGTIRFIPENFPLDKETADGSYILGPVPSEHATRSAAAVQHIPGMTDHERNCGRRPIVPPFTKEEDEKLLRDIREMKFKNTILNDSQQEEIRQLMMKWNPIFARSDLDLGRCKVMVAKIELKPGADSFLFRARHVEHALLPAMKQLLDNWLDAGVIRYGTSAFGSPVLMVPKPAKNGVPQYRLCIDFRILNQLTESIAPNLPTINSMLDHAGGARFIAALDLLGAYTQIPLDANSQKLCSFVTPYGSFLPNCLMFGLKQAPAIFTMLMNFICGDLQQYGIRAYLDDLLVLREDFEGFKESLEILFQRLYDVGLKVSLAKTTIGVKEVKYLGFILSEKGLSPNPAKVEVIANYPTPKTIDQIRSFVGLTGFFSRFVPGYANKIEPLTRLTKKNATFVWTEEQNRAFRSVIDALMAPDCLAHPSMDMNKPMHLVTDASQYAVGSCLMQRDDKTQALRPIAFASSVLSKTEQNYSATERELLGVVTAFNKFHDYLFLRPVKLYFDHAPLLPLIVKGRGTTRRLARMLPALSEYDVEPFYIPGPTNQCADALSRLHHLRADDGRQPLLRETLDRMRFLPQVPQPQSGTEITEVFTTAAIATRSGNKGRSPNGQVINELVDDLNDDLPTLQKHDPYFGHIYEIANLTKEPETALDLACLDRFEVWNGILYTVSKHRGDMTLRVCIPATLEKRVLWDAHDALVGGGHVGIRRTYANLAARYWFPKMLSKTEAYVKACDRCLVFKPDRLGARGETGQAPIPETPFSVVAVDAVGPLSGSRYRYLLCVTDLLSRYVIAIPLVSITAEATAKALTEQVFCKFGIPEKLISDNGSNFTAETLATVVKCLGIDHRFTTPYHPQGNGQAERNQSTLKQALKIFAETHRGWETLVAPLCLSLNSTVNSTGYSAWYLVFGREPRLPSSVTWPESYSVSPLTDYADQLPANMAIAWKEAATISTQLREARADRLNAKLNPRAEIMPGDMVLRRSYSHTPGVSSAWQPRYGSQRYQVISVLGGTATLKNLVVSRDSDEEPDLVYAALSDLKKVTVYDDDVTPSHPVRPTKRHHTPGLNALTQLALVTIGLCCMFTTVNASCNDHCDRPPSEQVRPITQLRYVIFAGQQFTYAHHLKVTYNCLIAVMAAQRSALSICLMLLMASLMPVGAQPARPGQSDGNQDPKSLCAYFRQACAEPPPRPWVWMVASILLVIICGLLIVGIVGLLYASFQENERTLETRAMNVLIKQIWDAFNLGLNEQQQQAANERKIANAELKRVHKFHNRTARNLRIARQDRVRLTRQVQEHAHGESRAVGQLRSVQEACKHLLGLNNFPAHALFGPVIRQLGKTALADTIKLVGGVDTLTALVAKFVIAKRRMKKAENERDLLKSQWDLLGDTMEAPPSGHHVSAADSLEDGPSSPDYSPMPSPMPSGGPSTINRRWSMSMIKSAIEKSE